MMLYGPVADIKMQCEESEGFQLLTSGPEPLNERVTTGRKAHQYCMRLGIKEARPSMNEIVVAWQYESYLETSEQRNQDLLTWLMVFARLICVALFGAKWKRQDRRCRRQQLHNQASGPGLPWHDHLRKSLKTAA